MSDDAQTAYLFQCGDEKLFAVSPDKAGENIPRSSCKHHRQGLLHLARGLNPCVIEPIVAPGCAPGRRPSARYPCFGRQWSVTITSGIPIYTLRPAHLFPQ